MLWFYLFDFIIKFVGSQENVSLIFLFYSSSLLPLRFFISQKILPFIPNITILK